MNSIQHFLTPWAASLIVLSLAACDIPPGEDQEATLPEPTPTPTAAALKPERSPTRPPLKQPTTPPAETVPVILYQIDNRCQNWVPSQALVPASESLEAAVGEIMDNFESADFSLGYRIIRDRDRQTVTIDFRIPATANRLFTSLSTCEQLALFGSLRKTLTQNPTWQIQQVHFTQNGEDIAL
ncbi:MAG: hypothetical protein ACP5D7_25035 [Limnospira sp.]